MPVEQAIFTSAVTDRAGGYQLLARSAGLTESDARELCVWSPSHDSLVAGRHRSSNFFPLTGGAFGISRTTLAEPEYSGRGGARVHTHVFVTPRDVLARFGNNPLLVLRAALAIGALGGCETAAKPLPALVLGGRAPAFDTVLKAQLNAELGEHVLARLAEAATTSEQLAIVGAPDSERLFAGLINDLPVERRLEFSFTTGLKHSPRRPFRMLSLDRDAAQERRLARQGVTIFDLERSCGGTIDVSRPAAAALALVSQQGG